MKIVPQGCWLLATSVGLGLAVLSQYRLGAEDRAPQPARNPPADFATDLHKDHWAFQPVTQPAVPGVRNSQWLRNPIDNFILALLENANLSPAPEADRVTLLRRLKFDLLGLPPTPEEVDAFVKDPRPDAYERLVERLLASPHYGERWARHWLDVVRFAESSGYETNQPRPNAWPYRDYVIRALNEDRPYDRFITEQLAGDTLGVDQATGFLVGGANDLVKSPEVALTLHQRADELHDMIGTTGSAFLGLTVGCARCHNHKFDPISQIDYYRMKAVFAGVQHGDRVLQPPDFTQRLQQAEKLQRRIDALDQALAQLAPPPYMLPMLLLDDDTSVIREGPSVTALVPRSASDPHPPGTGRGQRDDPGDLRRLPNLGKSSSSWTDAARRDVFTWNPKAAGRFRVWLSWGCGRSTHAADARYVLDADGDLATRDDQVVLARVDQRRFADRTGEPTSQVLWSGFVDAGVQGFKPESRIILRGGSGDGVLTADLLLLQAVPENVTGKSGEGLPHLRAPVNRLSNLEQFAPVEAKYVRFTILETSQLEPCIDELEVFTAGAESRNVALTSHGTRATASGTYPGNPIHKLEHINDGRFGNSWSWISNEFGKGWVQLEFPEKVQIARIVWSRDRPEGGRYSDRLPIRYRIEVAATPGAWELVASSEDRLPLNLKLSGLATVIGLAAEALPRFQGLAAEKKEIEDRRRELTRMPMIYAGRLTTPEVTHRLHRGDPQQKREEVAPAALASFGPPMELPINAPEPQRRQSLAKWITDSRHPLTARVLVNRLWHYHFGQGIVTTPSDFGLNGARPSHPELLDWLAGEFRDGGWSIKHIHRLIVRSSTYRQASAANRQGQAADAGSRLLWRYPPRRLEAEVIRDAVLSVSGKLDTHMGGRGFDLFEPNTNYVKVYQPKKDFGPAEWRRMIYQEKPRMELDDTFGLFDCPDAGQIAPKRTSSNTPLQALNLLNSPFLIQQAGFFAERLQREAGDDVVIQAHRAFRLAFSRDPSPDELAASARLIREHGLMVFCRALLNANEFVYVF